ncbi:helix-turn-helix transcriptional regulator [Streptomyces sp. NBC_00690]|uniref:helix-turn-helix transcriptional regulator n=1 Tax=Streptomyces sp. NBC_00690 TaxID=2975808 RepID=UPI002E27DA4B|nr:helix-turn-helix transcriptional regulator [Streptomyces sp. NBC_00690]
MSALESGTEVFARRLRVIREASGRSYGALAHRVGVSASTLHRYCSGHIVPLDFAPVARLAQLCGCRGEDLVELHRLWVLADGERRRRQAAGGVQARSAAGMPEALSRLAQDGTVQEDGDRAPEVNAAVTGFTGAAKCTGSAALEASPEVTVALEKKQAGGPQPEATGSTRAPEVPRRRAARATLATHATHATGLVAVAAVFTLLVTLLVLLAFERSPSSSEDRNDRQRASGPRYAGTDLPSVRASGTTAASSALPSPPSWSISPGVTASRPPVGPTASMGPGHTGSRPAPRESARASEPRNRALPFSWGVNQHIWASGCSHSYIVDRPPTAVPPPPSVSDAEPWARSLGAVHGGDTLVRLTIQGLGEQAVVLQGLRVRVAAQRPPQRRNVYGMSLGCGGTMTPRMFDVDLDAARPTALSVPGNDSGVEIPAASFPYRVSARDPEILLITARTVTCDCDWYLELEWSSADRSGTVRIDDAGRPFRTSSVLGGPAYLYDTNDRRWVPTTGADPTPHPGNDPTTGTPEEPEGPTDGPTPGARAE